MSFLFVDTSALVKFYYPEPDSDEIEAVLLQSKQIYISSLAITEMASALSKKIRMRELQKAKEIMIWNTFRNDLQTGQMDIIPVEERHYFKAADLIREFGRYGLKTLDAVHLSIVHPLHNLKLLCSDKTLTKVASKMGIKVAS